MIAKRIQVFGRVQGVFFRVSTREKAQELMLTGWERNEPDRSVLIEAEGTEESMEAFIAWCKVGPPSAIVEGVEVADIDPINRTDFQVSYSF